MTDRLWAGGDEAGTKMMHMERLGELRVRHKLTWKVSSGLSPESAKAHTCVPTHAHTRFSPFLLPLAVPESPWGAGLLSVGKPKGGCYCCSLEALLKIHSRYAPTLGEEAAFICTIFSPGKKYAYTNASREPGGDKKHTAKMVCDGWRCFHFHFANKIFTELMPSTLIGVKCAVKWHWTFVKGTLSLHPLRQSQYAPSKFKLEAFVRQTKSCWSLILKPASLILSK